MLQDGLQGHGVRPDDVPDLGELGVVEECSQVSHSQLLALAALLRGGLDGLVGLSPQVGRNAVDQVLHCPFDVIEGGSQGLDALLSGETHGHEFINIGLVGLRLGGDGGDGLGSVGLGSGDFLLLLLLLLLLGLFGLDLCLGLRLLRGAGSTCTCDMTTRKSVSLMPSFSMVSSLTMVLPL